MKLNDAEKHKTLIYILLGYCKNGDDIVYNVYHFLVTFSPLTGILFETSIRKKVKINKEKYFHIYN